MLPSDAKIFVARQPADLRKSIDGLALLARTVIQRDPLSGHLLECPMYCTGKGSSGAFV